MRFLLNELANSTRSDSYTLNVVRLVGYLTFVCCEVTERLLIEPAVYESLLEKADSVLESWMSMRLELVSVLQRMN